MFKSQILPPWNGNLLKKLVFKSRIVVFLSKIEPTAYFINYKAEERFLVFMISVISDDKWTAASSLVDEFCFIFVETVLRTTTKVIIALSTLRWITYVSDPFSYRIGVVFILPCTNPIRFATTVHYNSAPHQQVARKFCTIRTVVFYV